MRTMGIRQPKTLGVIIKFMGDKGVYTHHTILDHINSTTKYGCTSQRLSNILAKYPDFERVGDVVGGSITSNFKISTWRISEWGISEWEL